ncbi:hypothetical protein ACTMTF_37020 [Nonomuraea sp. ZG12]|uniref:hypothetical protein n=1 Tax=Nonomuraea sp. ZG12 TaxID=3452207 RepID=UPI003F8ABFB5
MSTNDSERDWFAPPPSQPTQPPQPAPPPRDPQAPQAPQAPQGPARPRRGQHRQPGGQPFSPGAPPRRPRGTAPFPDQQVWPPPRKQSVSAATQPIPAITSAGPLPSSAPPPSPPPPQEPAPEPTPEPAPASEPAAAVRPPARRGRTLLLGVGAVVAFTLGMGLPTADRYLFYKSGQPGETVHVVPVGQQVTYEHVTWLTVVEPTPPPAGTTHNTPDKQWLKITVTRKAADEAGTVLTGRPELTVRDKRERTWQVEIIEDNLPTDKHEVHRAYDYTALAVVPKAVADEVELHLEPNITYRSDTPTEKLLEVKPEDEEKAARNDVLIFRR